MLFLALLPLSLACPLWAEPSAETGAYPPAQMIDTRMDLGLFGLLGGGMSYSIQGKSISRYEDFKSQIYSMGDLEASNLIREAHEAHLTAWVFYVGGMATGLDVALTFKPTPLLGVDWFDRMATGAVAAQFFWAAGALFDSNAESRKYNAVQRYNHVLQKKQDDAFLDFSPNLCLGPQSFFLDLSKSF